MFLIKADFICSNSTALTAVSIKNIIKGLLSS